MKYRSDNDTINQCLRDAVRYQDRLEGDIYSDSFREQLIRQFTESISIANAISLDRIAYSLEVIANSQEVLSSCVSENALPDYQSSFNIDDGKG